VKEKESEEFMWRFLNHIGSLLLWSNEGKEEILVLQEKIHTEFKGKIKEKNKKKKD
jgi:hypothetical protein